MVPISRTKKSSPRSPCLMIVVPLPYLTASKLSRSSSFSGACGGRARRLPRRGRAERPGGTRAAALEERVRRHGLADELLDGVGLGDDLLRVVAEVDAVAADALVVVLRVDARERELRGRCRRIDQNSGCAEAPGARLPQALDLVAQLLLAHVGARRPLVPRVDLEGRVDLRRGQRTSASPVPGRPR